ncbi:MAG: SUMF1/EgtB/PvdO family nonheme iron enzyme [Deferribacteraceae bacterium]|jgi:formylglycine-generating enzyme required for sulfatase activity|nr:SUMF1/EgtB/PvdO family nonheme iron enzyme [Deferribacteraceae bacterium]
MKKLFWIAMTMLIAVVGCGGKSAEAPKAPVNQCMVGAPGWVTGNSDGGVTSIGTATIGNAGMSMARTMALGNARDEMARSISVKVNNMLKDFTQVTGIGDAAVVDKVTSSVSQQVASQTLQGSFQKGSWVSPCNELYVLMALDAAVVQAAVKQQVNSSYKNEKALWQQFQAQKAQDELSSAIEKEFSPAPQPAVQPVAPQVAPIPAVVIPAAQPSASNNMVWVEGGAFMMGNPDAKIGINFHEGPQHQVTVSGFWIGKYPVTQAEYEKIMGTNPSNFKGGNLPVEQVTWFDAIEYCNKLSQKEGLTPVYKRSGNNVTADWKANGYRLLTESEWEYAARGGKANSAYKYSGGNNVDDVCWYKNNSGGKTNPVGVKKANELGIHDMCGNVWEWVWDLYDLYSASAKSDPRGPGKGTTRVRRGADWDEDLERDNLRPASRSTSKPSERYNWIGFRVAHP